MGKGARTEQVVREIHRRTRRRENPQWRLDLQPRYALNPTPTVTRLAERGKRTDCGRPRRNILGPDMNLVGPSMVGSDITPRLGRPPEFKQRVTFKVLLEASERRAIERLARAAGVSASAWARRALVAAVRDLKGGIKA